MADKPKPKPKRTGGKAPAKPRAAGAGAPRAKTPAPRGNSYQGNAAYRGKPRRARRKLMAPDFGRRGRIAALLTRLIMGGMVIGGIALIYFAGTLPDIRALDTIKKQQGITIETADGRVIANYGDVYGSYIPYDELPKTLVQAVIATEDRRFFAHHGVDFWGIARALVTNVRHGHVKQGGSTVTQQVAKNVFLTSERSLKRKFQEVLLAFWLEGRFSKKEIMAIYLNRVYLGSGTFGVDAAARRYFNKSARELDLFESALMAGLLKAPSRYSPAANVERARERVHQVLVNMVDAGYLKQREIAPALASFTQSPAHEEQGGDVRYFTDWILEQIPGYVGQVNEDMVVTSTLATTLQTDARDALENIISTQGADKNISQGALVAMEPDGAVKAMIGGLSYAESQYNRAAQAHRQPGSSFKLFVYMAALEAGYTPQTIVEDAPITLSVGNKSWSPDNFDSRDGYRGQITLVEALRHSLNTVSVRLITMMGPARVAELAERMGIENVPAYPSIALGAVESTVLDMTNAYAHLANRGRKVVPYGIVSIRTRAGKEIYKRAEPEAEQIISTDVVDMMNYMLIDAAHRGTGAKSALAGHPSAGKTGTSQDYKDAWFIGFTPQLVTGVWVGNDNNKSMKKVTGGSIPALIWHDFMTKAMQGVPAGSIPNSATSSRGILPWLFGGDGDAALGDTPPDEQEPAPVELPADAPFALQNPNAPAPLPVPVAPKPAAAPAAPNEEVLTPAFWDKLMKDEAVSEGR